MNLSCVVGTVFCTMMHWTSTILRVFCTSESQAPVMYHDGYVHHLILELHLKYLNSLLELLNLPNTLCYKCGISMVCVACSIGICLCVKTRSSVIDELQMLNFHGLEKCIIVTCRCTTTGTSTTLFKNCTCGTSALRSTCSLLYNWNSHRFVDELRL